MIGRLMTRGAVAATVLLALLPGAPGLVQADGGPATSAINVQPLLIGSKVPAVTLEAGDGSSFALDAAIAKKPAILIFYRGGW